MNRNAIATAVREWLDSSNVGHVTGTIIHNAIDRACVRVNREAKLYRADSTVSIKSGTREVSLAGTITEIHRVRLGTGTQRTKLEPISVNALDRDNGDWEGGATGVPTRYYVDGGVIGFDPKPVARTAWAQSTLYAEGDIVIPGTENGFTYRCTSAGTSAATHPIWPTTVDGTVSETAGPTWQQNGSTWVYIHGHMNVGGLTASQSPTWCPAAYHDTIAKAAAIDIAGGFDADNENQQVRVSKLYAEYLAEMKELSNFPQRRSREYGGRITLSGYGTYRR